MHLGVLVFLQMVSRKQGFNPALMESFHFQSLDLRLLHSQTARAGGSLTACSWQQSVRIAEGPAHPSVKEKSTIPQNKKSAITSTPCFIWGCCCPPIPPKQPPPPPKTNFIWRILLPQYLLHPALFILLALTSSIAPGSSEAL